MKIGILTFHCAHNYGAVLQAYATQEHLKSQGHNVTIIDYRPEYLLDPYLIYPKFKVNPKYKGLLNIARFIKHYLYYTLRLSLRLKRRKLFNTFISNRFNLSNQHYLNRFQENLDYDFYIVGSDQVWNPNITRGGDPIYWGDFKRKNNSKIITYAASSAFYDFPIEQKKLLLNFDIISVREEKLQNYLKQTFKIEAETVVDPTILVDIDVWDKIAIKPKKEKYLLVYNVASIAGQIDLVANKIAKEKGLKIIYINNGNKFNNHIYGVEQFLGLFKYADYVVCGSFHGAVFATTFNRNFCVMGENNERDSRIKTLLENLGLKERFIIYAKDLTSEYFSPIDYIAVNKTKSEWQAKSRSFLANALK